MPGEGTGWVDAGSVDVAIDFGADGVPRRVFVWSDDTADVVPAGLTRELHRWRAAPGEEGRRLRARLIRPRGTSSGEEATP